MAGILMDETDTHICYTAAETHPAIFLTLQKC